MNTFPCTPPPSQGQGPLFFPAPPLVNVEGPRILQGPEAGQEPMPPGVGSVGTSLAWVEWHSRLGGILTCHCHPEDFCMSTPSQERPSEEKPWGHLFCSHDLRATQLHAGPGKGPGVTVRKVLCG